MNLCKIVFALNFVVGALAWAGEWKVTPAHSTPLATGIACKLVGFKANGDSLKAEIGLDGSHIWAATLAGHEVDDDALLEAAVVCPTGSFMEWSANSDGRAKRAKKVQSEPRSEESDGPKYKTEQDLIDDPNVTLIPLDEVKDGTVKTGDSEQKLRVVTRGKRKVVISQRYNLGGVNKANVEETDNIEADFSENGVSRKSGESGRNQSQSLEAKDDSEKLVIILQDDNVGGVNEANVNFHKETKIVSSINRKLEPKSEPTPVMAAWHWEQRWLATGQVNCYGQLVLGLFWVQVPN